MKALISVVIVDDHPLAITGLRNMLLDCEHIRIAGTYLTGAELLEGLKLQQPDVLLLDLQLRDTHGEELATIIRDTWPDVKILVITSLDAPIHIRKMLKRGCKGYLLKNTDIDTLIQAIEEVYKGNEYIEPALKEQMVQNLLHFRKPGQKAPILTRREQEIVLLITEGLTSHEIAERLYLSLRTVEKYRFALMQKLDVNNTASLVKTAIEMGLIQ